MISLPMQTGPWAIFVCLSVVFLPSREYPVFLYMETSPLSVKGCKIETYARRWWPWSREGSLSCHSWPHTMPLFLWSHLKDCSNEVTFQDKGDLRRAYSKPGSQGTRGINLLINIIINEISCFNYLDVRVHGVFKTVWE